MEENRVTYALLAIGLVALAGATAASYSVSQQMGLLLARTVPSLLCATDDANQLALAAPTAPSACMQILDMRAGDVAASCDSMPLAKRLACRQLVALAIGRTADCSGYAVAGTTAFSSGAPQAAGWCSALFAE